MDILSIIWWIIIFLISGIPLHIAVNMLGGKTSILKSSLVVLLGGIVFSAIQSFVGTFGTLIAFIVLIWIYREAFRLKWIKALLAWVLQFIVLFLLVALLAVFGISLALLA